MKSTEFWVKRYLWVCGMVFMILMAASLLLRGRTFDTALSDSFLWALISASVFTGFRYYQARKGVACALCKDTLED